MPPAAVPITPKAAPSNNPDIDISKLNFADFLDNDLVVKAGRLSGYGLVVSGNGQAVSLPKRVMDAMCASIGKEVFVAMEIDATNFQQDGIHLARARLVSREFIQQQCADETPGVERTTMRVDDRLKNNVAVAWSKSDDEEEAFMRLFEALRQAGFDPTLPRAADCESIDVTGLYRPLMVLDRGGLRHLVTFSAEDEHDVADVGVVPVRDGRLLVAVPFYPTSRGVLEHLRIQFCPEETAAAKSDSILGLRALARGTESIRNLHSTASPPSVHPVRSFSAKHRRPNDDCGVDSVTTAVLLGPTLSNVRELSAAARTARTAPKYSISLMAHALCLDRFSFDITPWTVSTLFPVEATSIEGSHRFLKLIGIRSALLHCLCGLFTASRKYM